MIKVLAENMEIYFVNNANKFIISCIQIWAKGIVLFWKNILIRMTIMLKIIWFIIHIYVFKNKKNSVGNSKDDCLNRKQKKNTFFIYLF